MLCYFFTLLLTSCHIAGLVLVFLSAAGANILPILHNIESQREAGREETHRCPPSAGISPRMVPTHSQT